jgi:hypothetical protein
MGEDKRDFASKSEKMIEVANINVRSDLMMRVQKSGKFFEAMSRRPIMD